VYKSEDASLNVSPLLLFPVGNDLLAWGWRSGSRNGHLFRINLTRHEATEGRGDVAWVEPGESILFSRTANGLTNIWKYNLRDQNLLQVTFGTGPDYSPMPDPAGTDFTM